MFLIFLNVDEILSISPPDRRSLQSVCNYCAPITEFVGLAPEHREILRFPPSRLLVVSAAGSFKGTQQQIMWGTKIEDFCLIERFP